MRQSRPAIELMRLICVPVVWLVHFIACYLAVSLACRVDAHAVQTLVLLATLLALALLAWIGVLSYCGRAESSGDGIASARFLALVTMMLCGLSALAVLWVAFPAAVLPPCAA